ncbi:hypothetical protein BOV89_10660 [Solemya velum gill symbiont]|uniref:hypothetical protein n=1 Tax=Solemya velum gill symbiont TaxID=2340 RepID=UPI000997963E|nr:hypothetical protein [Solemya velum gill symbiont]OOY36782.1 hypothetical protein BOV89_10660 [Solemya velum gill symbiont]
MRYAIALLICIAIYFSFHILGAYLGWKAGGGVIPNLVLFAALFAVWKAITTKEPEDNNTDSSLTLRKSLTPDVLEMEEGANAFVNGETEQSTKIPAEISRHKLMNYFGSIAGRLQLSFLSFLLLLMVMYVVHGTQLFSRINQDNVGFVFLAIAWYAGSFLTFTFLHWVIANVLKYWGVRKDLRLWFFGSGVWIVGVLLYVVIIDPYGIERNLEYLDDENYVQIFLVMFPLPLFLGTAMYIHEKYIK